MQCSWAEDKEVFDYTDINSIYMLAIEYRHAFNPAKFYLMDECKKGTLKNKTYGEIRSILSSIFGEPAKEILFKCDYN